MRFFPVQPVFMARRARFPYVYAVLYDVFAEVAPLFHAQLAPDYQRTAQN